MKNKTLEDFKDQVAISEGFESWKKMNPFIKRQKVILLLHQAAELYASQTKAVEPQQGWVKTIENPPKNRQHVLGWRVADSEGWIVPMAWNVHVDTPEEYPYYMIEPEPPTQTN